MKMKGILNTIGKIEDWIMILTLGYMVCSTMLQVILRYGFRMPLSWPEETARFAQIWLIYISTSACARLNKHINADILLQYMSISIHRFLEELSFYMTLALLLVLFYLGILLVKDFIHYGKTSPAVSIPMYFIAASIPIGMGLSILRSLEVYLSNKRKGALS